jgi:hypothetical protein
LRLLPILANLVKATGHRRKSVAENGALPALKYAIMKADIRWKEGFESPTACEPKGSGK